MHNRSNPASVEVREKFGNAYVGAEYENLIEDVKRELLECVAIAKNAGIAESLIVLDPGIGFGKDLGHNLDLMRGLQTFALLGCPVLVGPSRKAFIGKLLDLPVGERLEGTAAAVTACILRGANIVRVHDVKQMKRAAGVADALKGNVTPL